jgi:hypothetical protein
MKHKILFIFMVMLAGITIPKNAHSQDFGLEQNTDGSYTLFMNGWTITTDIKGNYTAGSTGTLTICQGCFAQPVYTSQPALPLAPDGYHYLSSAPPSGSTGSTNGTNGVTYFDPNGVILAYIPYFVGTVPSTQVITGYTQGCPSCEAATAQQANIDQMTSWDYENTIRTESSTQYAATQAYLQAQMSTAWQQQNAGLYYYGYYNNYYAQQVRFGYNGSLANLRPPAPPLMDSIPPRTDTVQPTKLLNCDTTGNKLDTAATNLLKKIDSLPQAIQARDSLPGQHEVSFSVTDSSGHPKLFPGASSNGVTYPAFEIGDFTAVPQFFQAPTEATIHIHEMGTDPLPDIADLYNVMMAKATSLLSSYNANLKYSYILCGDTTTDLAIAITDTSRMLQFLNLYPQDSVIYFDSTHHLAGSGWRNYIPINDSISMSTVYKNAVDKLLANHYSVEMANTYAQVYMLQRYNMGITILQKVNGAFKQLTASNITYDTTGKLQTITTNICP